MSGLILERHAHQTIVIGDNITITVLRARYGTVKVRIEAPESIPVWRGEIVERRNAERLEGGQHPTQNGAP